ncbi:MAG: class I SAM-dependent methyltransferase [Planctomycetota bacterium]|jgi:SAM-dependent methyltransferase
MAEIRGPMADLYDVFVDWPGRLGREMPGLVKHLGDAKRVLDVGCGTGQHVAALLREGFDAYGADASEQMLENAVERDRLTLWRMGEPCPIEETFDAVICLGNVWPQMTDLAGVDRALASIRGLLVPSGKLIIGMKAFAARKDPYLPLLRREHEGEPVFFIRFLEPAEEIANFHMVIAAGEHTHHRTGQVRVWSASSLRDFVSARGFDDVVTTHGMDGPPADDSTEDVFLRASAR